MKNTAISVSTNYININFFCFLCSDKVPIEGTQCNFEDGLCGWTNHPDNKMNWTLHSGPTPTDYT